MRDDASIAVKRVFASRMLCSYKRVELTFLFFTDSHQQRVQRIYQMLLQMTQGEKLQTQSKVKLLLIMQPLKASKDTVFLIHPLKLVTFFLT